MNSEVRDTVCSFGNLYNAMMKCKRGTIWKDSVAGFVLNGLVKIHRLKKSLENGAYKIDPYNTFQVHEPKTRDILSTRFKDRTFQKSLSDNYFYDEMVRSFIHDNGACQTGKGTEFERKRLIHHMQKYFRQNGLNGWVLTSDLKNFFGNTSHFLAYAAVAKRIKDPWVRSEIKRIIDSFNYGPDPTVGMGLGSEITQTIQSAVLDEFDHFVKEQLRIKFYERYNDDFVIIHPDKEYLKCCLTEIDNWFTKRGLTLHPRKTQISKLSQGIKFLGFRYRLTDTGRVLMTLLPKKVSHERRKLRKLIGLVEKGLVSMDDVDVVYRSFKAHIGNESKKKKTDPGRRAHRNCHGLTLAMDAYYKKLKEDCNVRLQEYA